MTVIEKCFHLEEKHVLDFEISRTAIVAYEEGGNLNSNFSAFNDPSKTKD